MSSSPSQRSARPAPKWRSTLSQPKSQRPATSVSLVFAQPEQGSKLGSAIDQLPVVGIDDAASFMSQSSRKRERTQSQASSFVDPPELRGAERNERQAQQQQRSVNGDVSRKRSKLVLDLTLAEEVTPAAASSATVQELVQGSATNPVDLTQSPPSFAALQNLPGGTEDVQSNLDSLAPAPQIAVPFPTTEPQKTVRASKSSPARTSWFGFSRGKGDDVSSTLQPPALTAPTSLGADGNAEVSTSTLASSDAVDVDAKASPSTSIPKSVQTSITVTPPQAIPPSGRQQTPMPMSFTSAEYSPPNHPVNSNTTSISSVDEEVPRPRFTSLDTTAALIPQQAIVESQGMKAAERKPSISSLNPSTSRFTLRLPLLGRPKVPLEQAVAVAQSEDIREPPTTEDTTISRDDQMNAVSDEAPTPPAITDVNQELLPTAEHAPEQPHTTTNNEPATLKSTSAPSEDDNKSHDPRAASWWDYIGWSGGHAEAHPKAAEDGPAPSDGQLVAEADSLPTTADAAQPHSEEQVSSDARAVETNVESGSQSVPSEAHTGGVKQSDGVETAKPSSIFSAETAKSHGSVWYSPWAWYGTSPTVTSGTQEHSSEVSSDPITADQKTDSEMVKEEALARAQNETTNPSPTQADQPSSSLDNSANDATPTQIESTPKTASPELQNPLETSIADNRSGWMSFFMSKALVTKAVTNESHDAKDDGMEVMEIDEEPQPSSAIEIPIGKDVQRAAASSSLKSSSPALSSPLPSPAPKSPSGKSPVSPLPKEKEPKKPEPPAAPLTDNESIKRETVKGEARSASPTPSKASGTSPPNSARAAPNFVLPTWEDTFLSPPRSYAPPRHPGAKSKLTGALSYVAGAFFTKDERVQGKGKGKSRGKGKEREAQTPAPEFLTFGQDLPKAFDVLGEQLNPYMLNGGCRVVVIGVAGWSPGAVTRTLAGGLPSSSSKFVDMTSRALEQFAEENGFKFKKISRMPLEGDGTIRKKVSRVYNHLVNNEEWMEDLHAADVIFVASHSQGAIISTHLVDRLIEDGHILTSRSVDTLARSAAAIAAGGAASVPTTQAQKVCLLALCGIHLGPLRYLKTSSLLQPYIQYVENAAARELFEFQDTESKLSKNYIGALRNVMDHGAKVVYVASLNDQVVPIYSGLFTAASHPRILRALYIDNDAYHSSDFLSNLLILLIRIMNAGLSDRGLLAHLSEATAGTLSGVGHSTAYEEPATYSLAVKYFFMTNDGTNADAELVINPFNAVEEQNDYEIPWLLRDMIADNKIAHFFAQEFSQLRDAFDDWQPKTTILRDVKKKLQPITRLSTLQLPNTSISKL